MKNDEKRLRLLNSLLIFIAVIAMFIVLCFDANINSIIEIILCTIIVVISGVLKKVSQLCNEKIWPRIYMLWALVWFAILVSKILEAHP